MDWIDLTEDWDQWRALVNTVMNLQTKKQTPWLIVLKRTIPTNRPPTQRSSVDFCE
jgi:hypothetical protein